MFTCLTTCSFACAGARHGDPRKETLQRLCSTMLARQCPHFSLELSEISIVSTNGPFKHFSTSRRNFWSRASLFLLGMMLFFMLLQCVSCQIPQKERPLPPSCTLVFQSAVSASPFISMPYLLVFFEDDISHLTGPATSRLFGLESSNIDYNVKILTR